MKENTSNEKQQKIALIDDGLNNYIYPINKVYYEISIDEDLSLHYNRENYRKIYSTIDSNYTDDEQYYNEYLHYQESVTHGTVCAAILYHYQNDIVKKNTNIYSIKILNLEDKKGQIESLIKAINWCYYNDINLIHMSIGSVLIDDFIKLQSVFAKVIQKNIVIVASLSNTMSFTVPCCYYGVVGVRCGLDLIDNQYFVLNKFNKGVDVLSSSLHTISTKNNKIFPLQKCNSYASPVISAHILNNEIVVRDVLNKHEYFIYNSKQCNLVITEKGGNLLFTYRNKDRNNLFVFIYLKNYLKLYEVKLLDFFFKNKNNIAAVFINGFSTYKIRKLIDNSSILFWDIHVKRNLYRKLLTMSNTNKSEAINILIKGDEKFKYKFLYKFFDFLKQANYSLTIVENKLTNKINTPHYFSYEGLHLSLFINGLANEFNFDLILVINLNQVNNDYKSDLDIIVTGDELIISEDFIKVPLNFTKDDLNRILEYLTNQSD